MQLKGFILTWFYSTTPLNRAKTADTIARKLEESGTKDVVVQQKMEGVSVSLNYIHFTAEQAAFLPEELPRLESLAGALKLIDGRSFRVIGHTAVADFLASHGISARRFLYEGRGGTEPVAPSHTEENMAKDRRVEIFIIED